MADEQLPYINKDGALYIITKLLALLGDKVNSEAGKTLINTTDIAKLAGIADGAQVNVIDVVKVNNVIQEIANKTLNLTIPTKMSELTNDSNFISDTELAQKGYQTASNVDSIINNKGYLTEQEVNTLIATAIGNAVNLSYSIVSELPQTGQDNVIYLMPNNSEETNNIYDEYIYIKSTSKFEKLGSTKLDLTGYLKETDLVPISNQEIDDMFENAEPIE